jgi:hypothetical protein
MRPSRKRRTHDARNPHPAAEPLDSPATSLEDTTAKTGPIIFHASTAAENRYAFRLNPDRWVLTNYRRNPVVLFSHDTTKPPIARADITQAANGLHASVTFDGEDPFATVVERKIHQGFLNVCSVS